MSIKEHKLGPSNLYVQEYLPQEELFSKPLVLVHGSFGGAFMWKMIAQYLSSKGFHCYALSLSGHKPNSIENVGSLGMQDYVSDIKTVVSELDLENPVVIGHSMSGLVVLMYAAQNPVSAVVSIDPSPSLEIQGPKPQEEVDKIPEVYTAINAGLPTDPMEVMQQLPDIPKEMLIKMKELLGPESGKARKDRKRGVSLKKEDLQAPILVIAGENSDSVKFGIKPEHIRAMAEYYRAKLQEIAGATHPGVLMGQHAPQTAMAIESWLKQLKF